MKNIDLPIFFIETAGVDPILTLNEETSKHIVQVLRMKPTERMQLTDGQGSLLTVEIVDGHKKKCTVRVLETQRVLKEKKEISIAISLLKNTSRFEWFLEKATEIGISEIIPLLCDRTEKQHFRHDRMRQILVSAMIQSKQTWLPHLHQPVFFQEVVSSSSYPTKLIAHCEEEIKASVSDFRTDQKTQILIGPEGDFSPGEIQAAVHQQYLPVSLGNTRLRAETAGVVAAALLSI